MLIAAGSLVPLAVLFWSFLAGGRLAPVAIVMTVVALLYVVVAGFFVAAACGYMAGLIGSSNSPVSGLAILAVLGAALILLAIARVSGFTFTEDLVAYALLVTAVLLCVATISNDNLQDLKTGQLVDATPWRQQVALLAGVVVGAAVIPPILNLLNRGYGFAGVTGAHSSIAQPLPAPQATLISALAKGVIGGQIDWRLIGIGAIVGAIVDRGRRVVAPAKCVAAAARGRLGYLSSGLDDRAGRHRCNRRLALQPLGGALRATRTHAPGRGAHCIGTHRRGKSFRRAARRARSCSTGQARAAGRDAGELRAGCNDGWESFASPQ